jgi:hypothetical protein
MALQWNFTQEEDGFVHLEWEDTKPGDCVSGARLAIETGSDFPIGISDLRDLLAVPDSSA